jgi:DNA-binding ferritin-like protein (Dps family)
MAFKVDLSKFNELLSIEKERQLAMKELSEILGYDVSFSDEEVIQNASEAYSKFINKEMNKEVLSLMKSLYS